MPIRRARCGRCQAKSADNTGCCKGERRQWRKQRSEAGAAVAECEGLLPPKHDAGTATRHYRAFWQRRCRAAAAEAVLKPLGGNCAVLPINKQQPRRNAPPAGLLLCCAAGSKTVKKVLDNLCGWCYSLAVKSIDREKYHPIAAQRAGP